MARKAVREKARMRCQLMLLVRCICLYCNSVKVFQSDECEVKNVFSGFL